jgi:hypothetical protein
MAALSVVWSGCSGLQELSIRTTNFSAAEKAWKLAKWDYYRQGVGYKMREHIGRGFRKGYADVANGSSGTPPIFPPGSYWGPEYSNAEGSELIAAWFRGYQDGALAAERSGRADYVALPTSWAPANSGDPYSARTGNPALTPSGTIPEELPRGPEPDGTPDGTPGAPPTPPGPMLPRPMEELPPQKLQPVAPPLVPGPNKTTIAPPLPTEQPPVSVPANVEGAPEPAAKPKTAVQSDKQTFLPPGSPRPSVVSVPIALESATLSGGAGRSNLR